MTEQEFIYGSLKQHTEQIDQLTSVLEQQQEILDTIITLLNKMQSPEHMRKQAKIAEMAEVADKIAFMQNLTRKI